MDKRAIFDRMLTKVDTYAMSLFLIRASHMERIKKLPSLYTGKAVFELFRIFFFAIPAAVNFFLLIGKIKYMRKPLLDGGNAAGVFALNHVGDLIRKA